MPVAVELASPWWLLGLAAAAGLLVAARWPYFGPAEAGPAGESARLRLPFFRRSLPAREARRLALRLAWVALLVLALARPTLIRPLDRQAIVFVVDVSASVAPVRDQAEDAVRTALGRLRDGDLAGVVAAAAGGRIEELPGADPLFSRLNVVVPDDATDLAAGLQLAAATLPEGYTGRLVLLTDGRQTRGDVVAAARELAARGVVVDVLPVGAEGGPDLRLDAVELPAEAHRGEVATLTARLSVLGVPPSALRSSTLRVYRDDALQLERPLELRAGRQEVAVPVPVGEPGLHRYRVVLTAGDPAADTIAANNSLGAVQRVLGPPSVLVVAPSPTAAGYLTSALTASGVEVRVVAPSAVPADLADWVRYDAVVLADVPADALPPGAMEQLEVYVRDLGRGLVMTGGPESFGPGGYDETPIERALPVDVDLRGRGRIPRVALALVIDKSGSMSGLKMELAKEAAVRSIRLLRDDDQAAILAFDSVPQWVTALTPLSERQRLEEAIGTIYAGGGTEIYPAVAAAFAALRDASADVKHLILLTDGRSGSGGEYLALLEQLREARVTLSTVAVGEDADTSLLQALARAGRGRYHFTADPQAIPRIFAQETVLATRSILVDAHFVPAAASSGPLLRGLERVPPLDGYVAVTPKERAEVVLVSPDGDPVLAAWQFGAGRSVAWTPDLTDRWSGAWARSPAATLLWGNVLSWILPPPEAGELAVQVEPDGAGAFSLLAENRSGWNEVRPTRATLVGPDGERREVALAPAGPGRYRAGLGSLAPGAYVVQVRQTAADGAELQGEAGWVAPYPAELRESGIDHALLTQVSAASGGRLLGDPAEAVRPAERPIVARWPLWPLLLVLAALAWPLEIAARRLALPAPAVWLVRARPSRVPVQPAAQPPGRQSAPVTPPEQTAERLLERKRALRQRRS